MKDLYAERVEKMEEYYEKLPVAESNDASTENINNILDKLENNKGNIEDKLHLYLNDTEKGDFSIKQLSDDSFYIRYENDTPESTHTTSLTMHIDFDSNKDAYISYVSRNIENADVNNIVGDTQISERFSPDQSTPVELNIKHEGYDGKTGIEYHFENENGIIKEHKEQIVYKNEGALDSDASFRDVDDKIITADKEIHTFNLYEDNDSSKTDQRGRVETTITSEDTRTSEHLYSRSFELEDRIVKMEEKTTFNYTDSENYLGREIVLCKEEGYEKITTSYDKETGDLIERKIETLDSENNRVERTFVMNEDGKFVEVDSDGNEIISEEIIEDAFENIDNTENEHIVNEMEELSREKDGNDTDNVGQDNNELEDYEEEPDGEDAGLEDGDNIDDYDSFEDDELNSVLDLL